MPEEAQLKVGNATAGPEQEAVSQCPRCRQQLIDPGGLGWCKACGYCRTLEAEQNNQLLQAAAQPTRGAVLKGVAGQVPWWFWVLVIGVGGLAGLSLAVGQLLPAGDCLVRAVWTSVQIALGLLMVFAGQFFAVMWIAPEDERLSFKDAIVPTRLWALVAKRLGRMYGCLWTSVWGLALVVCALLFVGGLKHWFSYLPGVANAKGKAAPAAARVVK